MQHESNQQLPKVNPIEIITLPEGEYSWEQIDNVLHIYQSGREVKTVYCSNVLDKDGVLLVHQNKLTFK